MIIIYNSATGLSKKYAEMLASELGIAALSYSGINTVKKGSDVIFISWLMAGGMKGLPKVRKNFNIKALLAVGSAAAEEQGLDELRARNKTGEIKLFYARGGLQFSKLKGLSRFVMKLVIKSMAKSKCSDEAAREKYIQESMQDRDFTDEKNIAEMAAYCKSLL